LPLLRTRILRSTLLAWGKSEYMSAAGRVDTALSSRLNRPSLIHWERKSEPTEVAWTRGAPLTALG